MRDKQKCSNYYVEYFFVIKVVRYGYINEKYISFLNSSVFVFENILKI